MTPARRHRPRGTLRFSDGSRLTVRGAARQLGARALTFGYRRMLFMAYPLGGIRIPVYHASSDVRFAVLGSGDMDAYLRFRRDARAQVIERRLVRGDRCFVSWHGDDIVDACWTATGCVYVPYLRRYLHIPQGDIYSYDSFTSAEHRGRGIYMARNSFTARQNQEEGFKRSVALVAFENYSAWLILTRSGLETLGAYHYVRTPMRGIYWETTEPGAELPPILDKESRERSHAGTLHAASGT
jgi:hypothetical protein